MDSSVARELFDANARSYDRVNTIISLGLDSRWRDWAASRALTVPHARVLDAFAGTGAVGLRVAELGGDVTLADASPEMLRVAEERARQSGLHVSAVAIDLTDDPLVVSGAPFDAVTAMWGLRYVDDPAAVLGNLAGLLNKGGSLVVVDFVEPGPNVISRLAGFYFFRILPKIASFLARRGELYTQLVTTTHRMGSAERLEGLVRGTGLEVVETKVMGFGLVLGIVGRREDVDTAT